MEQGKPTEFNLSKITDLPDAESLALAIVCWAMPRMFVASVCTHIEENAQPFAEAHATERA
jgi:hypothetical protein